MPARTRITLLSLYSSFFLLLSSSFHLFLPLSLPQPPCFPYARSRFCSHTSRANTMPHRYTYPGRIDRFFQLARTPRRRADSVIVIRWILHVPNTECSRNVLSVFAPDDPSTGYQKRGNFETHRIGVGYSISFSRSSGRKSLAIGTRERIESDRACSIEEDY